MKKIFLLCLFLQATGIYGQSKFTSLKKQGVQLLDGYKERLEKWNHQIWHWSEGSFQEKRTVALFKSILKENGFIVEENLSGAETMFVASYGDKGPVIGILGEYDAEEGGSNPNVPFDQPDSSTRTGFSAGHNLLGVGSLGATLVLKDLIEEGLLEGRIKFFGSTAEGGHGGRGYLARDGYFEGLDLSVFWHPSPVISANVSYWDAIIDLKIDLTVPTTPASDDMRGVVDAFDGSVSIMNSIAKIKAKADSNLLLHAGIETSSNSFRKRTEKATLNVRIEHPRQIKALEILSSLKSVVEELNGERQIEANLKVVRATHEFVANQRIQSVVQENFELLGGIEFDKPDEQLARDVLKYVGKSFDSFMNEPLPLREVNLEQPVFRNYGSDIGDVSWHAPMMSFVSACLPRGASMENWEGTVFSNSPVGIKGMHYASQVMILSIIDYLTNPVLRNEVKSEFEKRTKDYRYKSLLPQGTPDGSTNSKRS